MFDLVSRSLPFKNALFDFSRSTENDFSRLCCIFLTFFSDENFFNNDKLELFLRTLYVVFLKETSKFWDSKKGNFDKIKFLNSDFMKAGKITFMMKYIDETVFETSQLDIGFIKGTFYSNHFNKNDEIFDYPPNLIIKAIFPENFDSSCLTQNSYFHEEEEYQISSFRLSCQKNDEIFHRNIVTSGWLSCDRTVINEEEIIEKIKKCDFLSICLETIEKEKKSGKCHKRKRSHSRKESISSCLSSVTSE